MLSKKNLFILGAGAALIGLLALTQNATSKDDQAVCRFGGAFTGTGGGITYNVFQIPLDPAGKTAALRVTPFTYSAEIAGMLAMCGADSATEATGEERMTGKDTGKWSFVQYGIKQGNPPLICALLVYKGNIKFTSPDTFDVDWTLYVYPGPGNILGLENADKDGNGYPDEGATPALPPIPGSGTATRVPFQ